MVNVKFRKRSAALWAVELVADLALGSFFPGSVTLEFLISSRTSPCQALLTALWTSRVRN